MKNIYSHVFIVNTGETQTLIDVDQVNKIEAIKGNMKVTWLKSCVLTPTCQIWL